MKLLGLIFVWLAIWLSWHFFGWWTVGIIVAGCFAVALCQQVWEGFTSYFYE